jgi:acetolactate synthase I/II/III large subunit
MRVSDFIITYIAELGIKHVFVLPGGLSMHLVAALAKNKDITPVFCLHEQSCVAAAASYSLYNNDLGVVICTGGPGATNCITGCAAAYIDSVPLLIVSGQCKSADLNDGTLRQRGVQEVDIVSMVRNITKVRTILTDIYSFKYRLEKLINTAKEGRPGPVWLDIPLNMQVAEI